MGWGSEDGNSSGFPTAPKKAIVAFVERVTKEGSRDFVPPAERIATLDMKNDWKIIYPFGMR